MARNCRVRQAFVRVRSTEANIIAIDIHIGGDAMKDACRLNDRLCYRLAATTGTTGINKTVDR